MRNSSQPARGDFHEQNERTIQQADFETYDDELMQERRLLDQLFCLGFRWEEAAQLLTLRTHLYENREVRQRQSEDNRLLFARWLYEQGEITEK
jgi:hypothetical protein